MYVSVLLRVRVNPWKAGRNKEATGTEHVKGIPCNDFRGSTVVSATREKLVFHGTYPSRFPRKNAVPRNKTGGFSPFLQHKYCM